mgnify:CR=1 FL=1
MSEQAPLQDRFGKAARPWGAGVQLGDRRLMLPVRENDLADDVIFQRVESLVVSDKLLGKRGGSGKRFAAIEAIAVVRLLLAGRHVAAELLDLALVALPLAIGALVVDTLGDAHGGGQADRIVFGTAAVLIAAAVLWWNRGLREGRTGQSLGKQWLGLVTRDTVTSAPVGARAALLRRGTDTVTGAKTRPRNASTISSQ